MGIPSGSLRDEAQGDSARSNDASSPDVSMAADRDGYATEDSIYDPATALLDELDSTHGAFTTRKRKPAEPDSHGQAKRVRLAADGEESPQRDRAQQLPAEIWHHIFTFLDPRALGALLSVNKLFHTYLDPSAVVKISYPLVSSPPILPLLKADAIWQVSRRHFWPRMPAPLKTRSELDMWRIACSRTCQFCKTQDFSKSEATADQWHRGPGAKGVSPVFPFFLISCGNCLSEKSLKEIDILLSSTTPSVLLQGLVMVFMTSELHVVSPHTLSSGNTSTTRQVTKMYWPEHVESIKGELDTVKSLGSAAAEEWLKGLEVRGKHALADASRWERWFQSGGVYRMREPLHHVVHDPAESRNPGVPTALARKEPGHVNQPRVLMEDAGGDQSSSTGEELHSLDVEMSISTEPHIRGQTKRTKEEVAELKAKRRTEIERRALLLSPPLPSSVLSHMSSFQAALQIITPLDDKAWELLKPRLLSQRAAAEQRQVESAASTQAAQERLNPGPTKADPSGKVPNEVSDEDWDRIQGPVRARISSYADEIIGDGWNDGEKVTKRTSPQFAADVLLYVRKRFYAEVAKDVAAAIASGNEPINDPPQGPWTQKLTLENMKWIFDMKIKQHTERYRKELFLCSSCQGMHKFYGFEGVVQHYAAKHTSALSVGSVVVFWRAEWPEEPIFNPEPKQATVPRPVSTRSAQPPPGAVQTPHSHAGYALQPTAVYPLPDQGAPDGYYGYASQIPPYTTPTAYGPGAALGLPHGGAFPPPHPFAQDGSYSSYQQGAPHDTPFQPPGQAPAYPENGADQNPREAYAPMSSSHLYRIRLDLMSKVARETWTKIANTKGLPGAVKVCVTIHHIAKTFQDEFSEAASLPMFIDGISNQKEMRPVRNVNQLACKACTMHPRVDLEERTYSLPQLANHFSSTHGEAAQGQGLVHLDWRTDMLLLPDMSVLSGLRNIIKNNKPAYKLVRDTLPWAFEMNRPNAKSPKQPWVAMSTEAPLPGTVEDEDDDHYSPPLSIESSNLPQKPADRPAREGRSPIVRIGTTGDRPVHALLQTEPLVTQDLGHTQPIDPVPNLMPANVVYSRKESQRSRRQKASRQNRQNVMEPPDVPEKREEERSEPYRDSGGTGPYMGRSQTSTSHQIDFNYIDGQPSGNPDAENRPRASYPQDLHPQDVRMRDSHSHYARPGDGHSQDAYHPDAYPQDAYRGAYSQHSRTQEGLHRNLFQGDLQSGGPGFVESLAPQQKYMAVMGTSRSWTDDGETRAGVTLETHQEISHRDAIRVNPRHVVRQGTTAPEYYPRAVRYVDERGYAPDERRRSVSPRHAPPDFYTQGQYRERGAVPRYERLVYRDEEERITYGVHPHELPSRHAPPPAEAYEILEVRDPQGNYYIKRPIRRDPGDVYAYDAHPAAREVEPVLRRHLPPEDARVTARPSIYSDAPPPAGAPKRPRSRPDLEEYDPRFPAGGASGSAPRQRRY